MSHIAEEYAKSLGVNIGQPDINGHFYPIPSEKFITFHTNNTKSPARHYDYWAVTIQMIKPFLKKEGIDIIQIGGKDDVVLNDCDFNLLNCSFKQMTYVSSKSLLHFGIDSLPVHIASCFDKKIVCLYSNLFPECSGPIWNKKSQVKLISPDFSEIKPSLSNHESVKRVNEVKPEEIGCAVLDLLNIKHDLNNLYTLNIGRHFHSRVVEAVPNTIAPEGFKQSSLINLRCDYGANNEGLSSWLNYRSNLMTSTKITLDHINKSNIVAMTLFLEDGNFDKEYLNYLNSLGVKYSLICRDSSKLSELRFKFFDWTVEEYKLTLKKDLDFCEEICDNTFYESNKVLICDSKEYASKAHWKAGITNNKEKSKIIDTDDFWEEVEHFNIYNHGKSKKNRNRV